MSIFVAIPNTGGRLIGGLFAEGRVNSAVHRALVVPMGALDETGPSPTVSRIRDNTVERVPVTVGVRDQERDVVEITAGLAEGDTVLVGAVKSLTPGTLVEVK